MITFVNVSHSYDGKKVLDNINLILKEKRIGIIGCNGSGKSTLVKMINGLLIPTSGSVLIDGKDTCKYVKEIRKSVGFIFQNPDHQIIFPTVEEDIRFSLQSMKLSLQEQEKEMNKILYYIGLSHLKDHPSHLLSCGEKRLLSLAAVLVCKPKYLIFDESATFLDFQNKHKILRLIESLKQHIIYVTHQFDELEHFDRVIALENGKIILDGPPKQIIQKYMQRVL